MSDTYSNVSFMRWRKGEPRLSQRVFPPLGENHPAYSAPCLLCPLPLGPAPTQLMAIEPRTDEDRRKHDAGGWYTAEAILLHHQCVTALTDDEREQLAREVGPPA